MNLTISNDCISCGACAQVCPSAIIKITDQKPKLIGKRCIKCGHCEAICPTKALINDTLNHDDIKEIKNHPVLNAADAEIFLRSRRSIRCFKDKIVTKEETKKLINIGRYAQTGSNSQGVSYLVIASPNKMEALRKLTLDFFKNHHNPAYQALHKVFCSADRDILFRGAPMIILGLTSKDITSNAKYALTYIELYAPSLNLGTCWAGYLEEYVLQNTDEMRELLEIPEHLNVAGALLYGYPKYKYHRVVDREPLSFEWR